MRTNEHRHRERHVLRRLAAALLLALCVSGVGAIGAAAAATSPGIDLRLDFETGDGSQFSGFECPHAGTQFEVYDASATRHPPPRQGRYAARYSETPQDVWPGNDMVRCLGARYDSGESAGDDYYYALSLYVPASGLSDNLLWELHHPSSLYNLPACGVAPLALVVRGGALAFRISTGNCTVGAGYAYWEPGIQFETLPRSTWVDVVMHIVFSEQRDGRVEVWSRTGEEAFPALPQVARYGIPTLPWAGSAGVHGVTLYTELGLYAGRAIYMSSDSVYLDGYRRGTSIEAVKAEFPAAGIPAAPAAPPPAPSPAPPEIDPEPPSALALPVISGTPTEGQILMASTGAWSNEPTGFTYQWQWSRDRRSAWLDVPGATQQSLVVAPTLVDAGVRVIVTATNISGSASAASDPVNPAAATVEAPSALTPPLVAGSAIEGEALTASTGVWAGEPSRFAYAWQWSQDGGASWVDVSGATEASIDVTTALVGAMVRVVVTGFNASGSGAGASEPVTPGAERRVVLCRRPWAPAHERRRDRDRVFVHDDW